LPPLAGPLDALPEHRKKQKPALAWAACGALPTEACRRRGRTGRVIRRVHERTASRSRLSAPRKRPALATIGCHDLIEPSAKSGLRRAGYWCGSTRAFLGTVNAEAARDNGFKGPFWEKARFGWTSLRLGVVTLRKALPASRRVAAYPLHARQHARQTISTLGRD